MSCVKTQPLKQLSLGMRLRRETSKVISSLSPSLPLQATELFIGYLARKSHVFTVQGKRKTIQRRDIDACIPVHDELNFLEGTLDS